MKILILEDEIPAYQKLLSIIHKELPKSQIIGWARSVEEGKLLLNNNDMPDLIFSDIELLDGVSFDIFEQVTITCPIIFCTAFDKYVLKAFQTNGIAYLLKPYSDDNFKEALSKYQTLFSSNSKPSITEDTLSILKNVLESDKKNYKQRFTIKKKGGIKLLATKDIVYLEVNGDFCQAVDINSHKHIVNYTLTDIEKKVNPQHFFRINRSQLINIAFIERIEPYFKNRLSIKLYHSEEPLLTSSSKTPEFRKWIEG